MTQYPVNTSILIAGEILSILIVVFLSLMEFGITDFYFYSFFPGRETSGNRFYEYPSSWK